MTHRFKGVDPPLIIGQAPARGNEDKPPFAGHSGARLARLAGVGQSGDDLPAHFSLINLMRCWPGKRDKGDDFDPVEAKEMAKLVMSALTRDQPRWVLLMGHNVGNAFDAGERKYLDPWSMSHHRFVIFPHPSGINRWWNQPSNEARAEYFLHHVLYG